MNGLWMWSAHHLSFNASIPRLAEHSAQGGRLHLLNTLWTTLQNLLVMRSHEHFSSLN